MCLTSAKPPAGVNPHLVSNWISGGGKVEPVPRTRMCSAMARVVMLKRPGTRPGHHSLMVKLAQMGTVILSGDAAHFHENYDGRRRAGLQLSIAPRRWHRSSASKRSQPISRPPSSSSMTCATSASFRHFPHLRIRWRSREAADGGIEMGVGRKRWRRHVAGEGA